MILISTPTWCLSYCISNPLLFPGLTLLSIFLASHNLIINTAFTICIYFYLIQESLPEVKYLVSSNVKDIVFNLALWACSEEVQDTFILLSHNLTVPSLAPLKNRLELHVEYCRLFIVLSSGHDCDWWAFGILNIALEVYKR
jgi:hypothetical protein